MAFTKPPNEGAVFTQSMGYCGYMLTNVLVFNDFSSFYLNLLIEPLAVTATFSSALVGAALGASIETPQAVFIKTVAEVHPTVK